MKTKLYYLLGLAATFIFLTSAINFGGGSPGGKSGSPGDGGNTCTDCHSGTAISQPDWISTTIPAEGYTPGETYTITASGSHSGVSKFGFETTAEDMNDAKIGTLMATNSTETQLTNGDASITHKSDGTTPSGDSKSWSFDWTAPAEGSGEVTFYAAFNAANGNGNTSGDVIYTSSHAVQENVTSSITKLNKENTVNVFPNPFIDFVNIQVEEDESEIGEVCIYNSAGQMIHNESAANDHNNIRINTSDLTPGVYHFVMELTNKTSISKTVVKR